MSYYRLKDILEEAKIAVSAFADEEVLSELRNRALDQTSTLLRAWEGIKDSASRTDAVLVTDRDFKQLTEQIVKSLRRFPHSRPNVPDSEWTQEKKTVSSKANRHEATAEDKMAATAMWFDEAQGVFESWKTGLSDEEVAFKLTEEDGSVNYALSQAIYFLRRPASDDRASEER